LNEIFVSARGTLRRVTTYGTGAESRTNEWTGQAELGYLLQRVQSARAAIEAQRAHARSTAASPEQVGLLDSLESYVAALQARHLPIPPSIRDELNLQRCLVSRRTVTRPATRRRAVQK
jgi:hypothetical protein